MCSPEFDVTETVNLAAPFTALSVRLYGLYGDTILTGVKEWDDGDIEVKDWTDLGNRARSEFKDRDIVSIEFQTALRNPDGRLNLATLKDYVIDWGGGKMRLMENLTPDLVEPKLSICQNKFFEALKCLRKFEIYFALHSKEAEETLEGYEG